MTTEEMIKYIQPVQNVLNNAWKKCWKYCTFRKIMRFQQWISLFTIKLHCLSLIYLCWSGSCPLAHAW